MNFLAFFLLTAVISNDLIPSIFSKEFQKKNDSDVVQNEDSWNGWPTENTVSEVTALYDHENNIVFYKDLSVPACFVENKENQENHSVPNFLKVLAVSNSTVASENLTKSKFLSGFCESLPILMIKSSDSDSLHRVHRSRRRKRCEEHDRLLNLGQGALRSRGHGHSAGGYTQSQVVTKTGGTGYHSGQFVQSGSQGQIGQSGSRGQNGQSGSQGQIGQSGSRGQIGQSGSQGQIGQPGSRGQIGQSGSPGQIGQSGSPGQIGGGGTSRTSYGSRTSHSASGHSGQFTGQYFRPETSSSVIRHYSRTSGQSNGHNNPTVVHSSQQIYRNGQLVKSLNTNSPNGEISGYPTVDDATRSNSNGPNAHAIYTNGQTQSTVWSSKSGRIAVPITWTEDGQNQNLQLKFNNNAGLIFAMPNDQPQPYSQTHPEAFDRAHPEDYSQEYISEGRGQTFTQNGRSHSSSGGSESVSTVQNGNGHSKAQNGNGHSIPQNGNGHSTVQNGNGHSIPQNGNGHSTVQNGNGHSIPQNGNGHSLPQNGNGHSVILNGNGQPITLPPNLSGFRLVSIQPEEPGETRNGQGSAVQFTQNGNGGFRQWKQSGMSVQLTVTGQAQPPNGHGTEPEHYTQNRQTQQLPSNGQTQHVVQGVHAQTQQYGSDYAQQQYAKNGHKYGNDRNGGYLNQLNGLTVQEAGVNGQRVSTGADTTQTKTQNGQPQVLENEQLEDRGQGRSMSHIHTDELNGNGQSYEFQPIEQSHPLVQPVIDSRLGPSIPSATNMVLDGASPKIVRALESSTQNYNQHSIQSSENNGEASTGQNLNINGGSQSTHVSKQPNGNGGVQIQQNGRNYPTGQNGQHVTFNSQPQNGGYNRQYTRTEQRNYVSNGQQQHAPGQQHYDQTQRSSGQYYPRQYAFESTQEQTPTTTTTLANQNGQEYLATPVQTGASQNQNTNYQNQQRQSNGTGGGQFQPGQRNGKQCHLVTFTCTIINTANGRAKLCRPKVIGNGQPGTAVQPPNTQPGSTSTNQEKSCCICCC